LLFFKFVLNYFLFVGTSETLAPAGDFKAIPNISSRLSTTYHQKIEDSKEWLSLTEWSQKKMDPSLLERIQKQLLELHIIDKSVSLNMII